MTGKGYREIMSVVDLKSKGHTFRGKNLEAMIYEYWDNFVCSSYGFHFLAGFSTLRRTLLWEPQSETVFVLGSISMYGLCPTNISGEPSGHRNLFADDEAKVVSCRSARGDSKKHAGQRQQQTRLENLCGLCSDTDPKSKEVIRGRRFWRRTQAGRLRAGRDSNRFMPFLVSVGEVSQGQSRGEITYSFGFTREYTDDSYHYSGQYSRGKYSRRVELGAAGNLHYGSGLFGLCTSLCNSQYPGIFRNQGKKESRFQTSIFSAGKQGRRDKIRSDREPNWALFQKTLSRKDSPHWLFRCGNQKEIDIHNQQHETISKSHCRSLQITLASRAIIRKRLNLKLSLYTILQILSVALFEKIPILQAFAEDRYVDENTQSWEQLELQGISLGQ